MYEIWEYKQRDGSDGCILKLELLDASDGCIQALFFNESAWLFSQELENGQIYLFSNGRVSTSDWKYTTLKHPY